MAIGSHRLAEVKETQALQYQRCPLLCMLPPKTPSLFLCRPIFKQLWFTHLPGPTWDTSPEVLHHGDLYPKPAKARLLYFNSPFHSPAQMMRAPGRQQTFFQSSGADVAASQVSDPGDNMALAGQFGTFCTNWKFPLERSVASSP